MNKPHKFVQTLSYEDYHQLIKNYQTNDDFQVRRRSQAILLSFQRHIVETIAAICQVHRSTVGIWIDNWNEAGFAGLETEKRFGRPPILNAAEQEKACHTAMRKPKFPHRQLAEIKAETGKEISSYTLKRILKKKIISGKESS